MPNSLFPCERLPEDAGSQKLLGLYRQRQEGLWLQRVRVPGGILGRQSWQALAAIARRFSPQTPLHLTTRQDVELHDLPAAQIPATQQALAAAGLTGFAAAGDTVRNITVCPCSGIAVGSVDLHPLAQRLDAILATEVGIYALPRKFKIALACSDQCGQPWVNDLGLVACAGEGQWGVRVITAGSLGARPGTGMLLFDWLPTAEILPLALAAVRVFATDGDRANRAKARLRHVRERMGDEVFRERVETAFMAAKAERAWDDVLLSPTSSPFPARATLTFPNGDLSPETADELGQLAGDDRLRVRIANQHRVLIFGRDEQSLTEALADQPHARAAARPQPCIVACPGRRWCQHASVHTSPLADRIRAEWGQQLPADASVCISGCPNGCSHAGVA
nr:nitrite/sulfite reductase [Pirellulaceae bacterium]